MDRADVLTSYLDALGLERATPSADFLTELVSRHVARIPFSSVGPMLGDDLPLDLVSLHDRLIVRRRGGYCFEQNRLMFEMLEELGFRVHRHLARVVYGGDPDPPLNHRVTIVDVDGVRFITDVGFGGIGPVAPIPMQGPSPEPTWRAFRVTTADDGRAIVEAERKGGFTPLYVIEVGEAGEIDCDRGHVASHRVPDARFVNHLVVMRTWVDEVRSLSDRSYVVQRPSGDVREVVASADRLHEILTEEFELDVTPDESGRLFAQVFDAS